MTPERRARITYVLNNRQPDFTIVLENVFDPHNIFAAIRTCDAVGVQEVFVVNTQMVKYRKFGKKSSASAAGWLTIHQFDNLDACFAELRKRYTKVYATHLGDKAATLYELDLTEPVALVFGNENFGVSEECLSLCDGNFIIPQAGMVQSLNVSVACAVSLYEGFRQRLVAGFYNGTPRLPKEQWNELAEKWGMGE
ncbi:TrmH family RNA methyltransferase [Chitinophagaceae bacterium MMS25-I14]